jgi:hypothetical protein
MSAAPPPESGAGEPVIMTPSGGTLPALAVVVGDERVVEETDKLLIELVVGAVAGGELRLVLV